MRHTDLGLVFIIIFICFSTVTDSRMVITSDVGREQIKYNNAIDTAVSDSLYMLVEYDDGQEISFNPDNAIRSFFSSLCINLGMNYCTQNMESLKEYIPVMIFVLSDGYIVYHHEYTYDGNKVTDSFVKSEKKYFRYEDDKYSYCFELGDNVVINDGLQTLKGNYNDIAKIYTDSLAADEEQYRQVHDRIIIDSLTDELKMYTSKEYLDNGNGNWSFNIPYGSDDVWNRTVSDISLIAVFAGYPYSDTSLGYYNKFAFGGARIWKKE